MSYAFIPLRRLSIDYVIFGGAAAACGVAESWRSSLALIFLLVGVPLGVLADRSKAPHDVYPSPPPTTEPIIKENAQQTALRSLIATTPLWTLVLIGVLLPTFGGAGAGLAVGMTASRLLGLRTLVRDENYNAERLIVQTRRSLISRKKPPPVYFKEHA